MEITVIFSGYDATLSSIESGNYVLRLPKARNASMMIADFLDTVPDFNVLSVERIPENHDLIHFKTDSCVSWSEVVEEVVNAISDIYDCDVRVVRFPLTPAKTH